MRGTLLADHTRACVSRIIPAHAGNTLTFAVEFVGNEDHPRACGEHEQRSGMGGEYLGSSPRMRGTHSFVKNMKAQYRIIPAHAGNTHRRGQHRREE